MAKFAVIGLGKFGMTVTTTLYENGAEVIAIDNNRKMYKVQVKCCKIKNNVAILNLRSSMSNKTMLYTKIYTQDEVDVFAMYIPNYDICLYVKSTILDYRKRSFDIRFIDNTKNNRLKGVNFYPNFRNFPIQ